MMKFQSTAGGEPTCATEMAGACAKITSLLATFSALGLSRELTNDELPLEIAQHQIAIYNDLRMATAALSEMTAATSVEVAGVGGVIRQLRERFEFCGFEELTILVQAHERDLARVTSCETDRAGHTGWISRRLNGLLCRSEYTTEH